MMYALDTNVIIEFIRENKSIIKAVGEAGQVAPLLIPPYADYEVMRGIYDKNAKKQEYYYNGLKAISKRVDVDEYHVMDRAAKLHADRKKQGKPIDDIDLLIAAWCVSARATLVTENTRHFVDIPDLHIENWMERPTSEYE
jgi:tRNA(fMet)-specific endonuclease VapC